MIISDQLGDPMKKRTRPTFKIRAPGQAVCRSYANDARPTQDSRIGETNSTD